MKLTKHTQGSVMVLTVEAARIGASTAIQFKDLFRQEVQDWAGPVVLNLSTVDFLDSSGLGAVVAARKLLGEAGRLELAGLTPAVEKVFRLTRMNAVFPIHETLEQALAEHGVAPAA